MTKKNTNTVRMHELTGYYQVCPSMHGIVPSPFANNSLLPSSRAMNLRFMTSKLLAYLSTSVVSKLSLVLLKKEIK